MKRTARTPLLLLAATAGLVLPGAAPAAARQRPAKLSGTVVAAPARSGSKVLIGVLLSASSVRAAHLHSPVVMLSVSRRLKVAIGNHKTLAPTALIWGDVVQGSAVVSKKVAAQALPAIGLSKLTRSSHLAVAAAPGTPDAALAQQVASLQQQLDALSSYVHQLAAFTYGALQSLRADMTSTQANAASLASTLAALQAALGNVSGGTSLATQVGTLATQVSSLGTGLGTVTSQLNTVAGKLTGISPGDLTNALQAISALQTLTNGLDVAGINSQLSQIATKIGGLTGTDLQTQLNSLSGLLTTLTSRVNIVCSPTANLLSGPLSLLGLTHFAGC